MDEFTPEILQTQKPSFSFLDIDPNTELMNHFAELNPTSMENPNLNFQSFMGFSSLDNFFMHQQPEFPGNLADNFPSIFHHEDKNVLPVAEPIFSAGNENKKRKAMDVPESCSGNSSPPVSEDVIPRKNSSGRGKRRRRNEEEEKPNEVVHVRARRGQATDSHSLAERVRRGKINERLRCLQGIVPGCYKFLSMKLTAASRFYDFNSETDDMEALQRAKAYEAQKVQSIATEGNHQGLASTQLASFDHLSFGSYPSSLPYNT
ncbi:hypothetical protein CsSME_00053976 [Camellia sinensis var. sinensis]